MIASVILILVIAAAVTFFHKQHEEADHSQTLANTLNQLLPQTQCEACGYKGCAPYADAMAAGRAPLNLCPPGGKETSIKLHEALGQNPDHGSVATQPLEYSLAIIDEDICIGCTKCIKACPIDVIIGGPKRMHTVLADACTGCGLCVPPCPVDCIDMLPIQNTNAVSP